MATTVPGAYTYNTPRMLLLLPSELVFSLLSIQITIARTTRSHISH